MYLMAMAMNVVFVGKVKSGYGRGSKTLGFPTANLPQFEDSLNKHQLPNGVYCGWAMVENGNKLLGCVSNIGFSPTFVGKVSDDYFCVYSQLLCSYICPSYTFIGKSYTYH